MRDCSWIPNKFENAHPGNFNCCSDRTCELPNGGYNCIAWAAGKRDNWWWPVDDPTAFWPIPLDPDDPESLEQFIKAFATEGYYPCEKQNPRFENGFEKVAIFVDGDGVTHAARMLPSGIWTSKMGKGEDIEHKRLKVVEGKEYGKAKTFLKRPNPLCQKPNLLKKLFSRLLEFSRARLKQFSPIAKRNQMSN
ncbi:MAG: hypothetical protein WBW71_14910 [Bacteroidota bacterium]